jgi:CheY-like chemotaxis protein
MDAHLAKPVKTAALAAALAAALTDTVVAGATELSG